MIVKVQIPLAMSPGLEPLALVYDHWRVFNEYFPITEQLLKVMKDRDKVFFYALERDGKLILVGEAQKQNW